MGKDEGNMFKVLLVCTSSGRSKWGSRTGLWLDELAEPYYTFLNAGYEIDICSINGGSPPIDPASFVHDSSEGTQQRFLCDEIAQDKFSSTPSVAEILLSDKLLSYSCIYLCGGHGCFGDFADNDELTSIIEHIYCNTGGCVAAVCHGPIALLNCKSEGKYLLCDKYVAAFSNEEEELLGLHRLVPFLVETEMDNVGAICIPRQPWIPNAVVDGRLVTGQNPQSALEVALRALDVLRSLGPKFSPPENANKPWGE